MSQQDTLNIQSASDNSSRSVTPTSLVKKTPDVCGGDACIRSTRIPVWLLVRSKQLGMTEAQIRADYDPPLTQSDLEAAWSYFQINREEIELAIRDNEED